VRTVIYECFDPYHHACRETLVVQVVPPALLNFSRAVLRERFSSIIQKPVYTFQFARGTAVTPILFQKLLKVAILVNRFAVFVVAYCLFSLGEIDAGRRSDRPEFDQVVYAQIC
jgi:hypothetical protein